MSKIGSKIDTLVDELDERKLKRRSRKERLNESLAKTLQTTTKQLIWWFTIHGTIWIYLSYILAFTEHTQIAETLSSNVCTVVIGSMGMYVISKTVENVFKYNDLGGTSNKKALEREGTADPGVADMSDGIPVIDMTGGIETNGIPEDEVTPDDIDVEPDTNTETESAEDPVVETPTIPETPEVPTVEETNIDPSVLN